LQRFEEDYQEQLRVTLTRSKVLVAFFTPRYFTSRFTEREFRTFDERQRQTGKHLLAPVAVRGSDFDFPDLARDLQWMDLRELSLQKSTRLRPPMVQRAVRQLAEMLNKMLDEAPPYEKRWTVSSNVGVSDPTSVPEL
jgi:hypothetical protein